MAEKASLYELLGLDGEASSEDIRLAFDKCRLALADEPDLDDRRNRLSFLQHAHDVLSDPRRRAAYDQQSRDKAAIRLHQSAPSRSAWPALVLLALVVAAYPAWQFLATTDKRETEAPAPEQPTSLQPPASEHDAQVSSEEIAALLQVPVASPLAENAAPTIPAVPQPATPTLVFNGPEAGAVAGFAESTYMIIGAAGLGTGVVVGEPDKLLTNCHVIAPNVLKGPMYAINPATRVKTRITAAAFLIREDACVVHAPGLNGKPIAMGNSAQLARGARIFNIGFANGQISASSGQLLGIINRVGQDYLATTNRCDHGVSGGPLVDAEGRLVGLTSGGTRDRRICLSLTSETARTVLTQTLIAIDAFPPNYMSNLERRW